MPTVDSLNPLAFSVVEKYQTVAQAVPTGTSVWTPISIPNVGDTFYDDAPSGSGHSLVGVSAYSTQATLAGVFFTISQVCFSSNATGRRLVGVSYDTTMDTPAGPTGITDRTETGAATAWTGQTVAYESLPANTFFRLLGIQTSGANLNTQVSVATQKSQLVVKRCDRYFW